MSSSDSSELTARQQREIEFFSHRDAIEHVDLEKYEDPSFGPWDPYWVVYDRVKKSLVDQSTRLLVYGCGRGSRALNYANLGFEVWGFDIAPNQVECANQLAEKYGLADRTHFEAQPAETLSYEDNFFDVVAGVNILHHVELPRAMPELNRVMKPGSRAYFFDTVATPRRDVVRNSRLVTWAFPKPTNASEDEHPITKSEMETIRGAFSDLHIDRYRVLGVGAKALGSLLFRSKVKRVGNRAFRKIDHACAGIAPVLKRFGDEVVLTMTK